MKQTTLPTTADARSPAGADIRLLMDGPTGNMIHSTVAVGQINRATVHATVSEFWYILEGAGEIWRRMLGALVGASEPISLVRPRAATALRYRRLPALEWTHFGVARRADQPALRDRDGSIIAIY